MVVWYSLPVIVPLKVVLLCSIQMVVLLMVVLVWWWCCGVVQFTDYRSTPCCSTLFNPTQLWIDEKSHHMVVVMVVVWYSLPIKEPLQVVLLCSTLFNCVQLWIVATCMKLVRFLKLHFYWDTLYNIEIFKHWNIKILGYICFIAQHSCFLQISTGVIIILLENSVLELLQCILQFLYLP